MAMQKIRRRNRLLGFVAAVEQQTAGEFAVPQTGQPQENLTGKDKTPVFLSDSAPAVKILRFYHKLSASPRRFKPVPGDFLSIILISL
jgi:hypothetical protein